MEQLTSDLPRAVEEGYVRSADPKSLVGLIELLRQIPSAERVRVVEAAMIFLQTPLTSGRGSTPSTGSTGSRQLSHASEQTDDLPRRVQTWLAQNNLVEKELESVFHRTGAGFELIAHSLPATTNKERVQQCYLLSGARAFLSTGEPRFDDEAARQVCRDLGFYDRDNHSTYMKAIGNLMIGSKSTGFELTQPGLRAAAEMIRNMSS